jgi:Plexin repeat
MRFAATTMAAALIVLGACQDSSDDGGYYGYASPHSACHQYTSCGSCTPVSGCGWCTDSDGRGLCVSDPDDCPTPAFTWTWNETGCRVESDAGVGSVSLDDAGPPMTSTDTGDATPTDDASDDANSSLEASTGASTPDQHAVAADAN